jgi:hypothetical protein
MEPIFLGSFFQGKSYALIFIFKMGWAAFWAIYSQTRLATLAETHLAMMLCK